MLSALSIATGGSFRVGPSLPYAVRWIRGYNAQVVFWTHCRTLGRRGSCLHAHRGELSVVARYIHHHHCTSCRNGRHCAHVVLHAHNVECACTHGSPDVRGGRYSKQHSSGVVRERKTGGTRRRGKSRN